MNERLRTVMIQRGITEEQIAEKCQCDPKTVGRWITTGRRPHRKHRWLTAQLLGVDESYLWPPEHGANGTRTAAESELLEIYADRASVPRETWLRLITEATEHLDVLVFSGTFFAQTNPRVAAMLADRAAAGVHVRLCFGNPASAAVQLRDQEEGLRGTLRHKIHASLTYYTDLVGVPGCEVRLHDVAVYASLFRSDDDLMVNPHIWGQPASANPLLHLHRLDEDGWFDRYVRSFDDVWTRAHPWNPDQDRA